MQIRCLCICQAADQLSVSMPALCICWAADQLSVLMPALCICWATDPLSVLMPAWCRLLSSRSAVRPAWCTCWTADPLSVLMPALCICCAADPLSVLMPALTQQSHNTCCTYGMTRCAELPLCIPWAITHLCQVRLLRRRSPFWPALWHHTVCSTFAAVNRYHSTARHNWCILELQLCLQWVNTIPPL